MRTAVRRVRGPSRPALTLSGPALLGVAMLTANGLHYLFNIVQSRLLGPSAYGALGALLGLVLLGSVPGLALQAVAARHTALRDRDAALDGELWAVMLRGVAVAGAVLGVVAALTAPALVRFLHLDSVLPALALAACLAVLPLVSVLQGLLQGAQRWRELATLLLTGASIKLVAGVALVLAGGGVASALAGALIGYSVEIALGLALVRPSWTATATRHAALVPEIAAAGAGILGLWLLVNVDVVLARHLLPAADSGLYAVGTNFAKIAYWAPQPIVVVLYPRLVTSADPRGLLTRGVALIAGLGVLLAAAAAIGGRYLLALAFGPAYLAVAPVLWVFALLGTALALVQLVLYAALAARRTAPTWLLLSAVAVECLLLLALAGSIPGVAVVAAGTAVTVFGLGWRLVR